MLSPSHCPFLAHVVCSMELLIKVQLTLDIPLLWAAQSQATHLTWRSGTRTATAASVPFLQIKLQHPAMGQLKSLLAILMMETGAAPCRASNVASPNSLLGLVFCSSPPFSCRLLSSKPAPPVHGTVVGGAVAAPQWWGSAPQAQAQCQWRSTQQCCKCHLQHVCDSLPLASGLSP